MKSVAEKPNIKQSFLENFGTGVENSWYGKEALEAINALEFPSSKTEDWKYTRINKLLKGSFANLASSRGIEVEPYLIDGLESYKLVFVNGVLDKSLSDYNSGELTILSVSEAIEDVDFKEYIGKFADHKSQIFTALNTAYFSEGSFIKAAKGVNVSKPVQIISLIEGSKRLCQTRNLFIAEENSQVELIHGYHATSVDDGFNNVVTEVIVGEGARLEYTILQDESDALNHINTTQVCQESNSTFSIATITTGGKLVRNNLNIVVNGEGCETNLSGLYLTGEKQHVDNHTLVDHAVPNCQSNELYKGIMKDASTAVFNGKVFVRKDAQKTNAFQSNANILVGDDATVNSKPELEIYADDVKCSHGSTTGQMDEDAMFYLRSRGIKEENARSLLMVAFVADVLENISNEEVRAWVEDRINTKL